jgi:hypothetical protein
MPEACFQHDPESEMQSRISGTCRRWLPSQQIPHCLRKSVGLRDDGWKLLQSVSPVPHPLSLLKIMVPLAANMPPTPWATEILAPATWAAAVPRIWRTLSCSAYMPYMPECM